MDYFDLATMIWIYLGWDWEVLRWDCSGWNDEMDCNKLMAKGSECFGCLGADKVWNGYCCCS